MKALFPLATKDYVLSFQFSSWYPLFTKHTIKSNIIHPLSSDFWEYLDSDGVFVPEGSENAFVFDFILHEMSDQLRLLSDLRGVRFRTMTMKNRTFQRTTTMIGGDIMLFQSWTDAFENV